MSLIRKLFVCYLIFWLSACIMPYPANNIPTQLPPPAPREITEIPPLTPFPTVSPASATPQTQKRGRPTPTATAKVIKSSNVAIPTPSGPRYQVQAGTPAWTANFVLPEAGCNWSGVAGQIFGLDGQPAIDLVVQVTGVLDGKDFQQIGVTGGSKTLGPGGFEITLADKSIDSNGSLWIQVFDLNGKAQTDKIAFDTMTDCDHNLILINFNETTSRLTLKTYFPSIIVPDRD